VREGWDMLVLSMIQYPRVKGKDPVLDRFYVNVVVGIPDFAIGEVHIAPESLSPGQQATITGAWENAGEGRYYSYTGVEVYRLAGPPGAAPKLPDDTDLVWAGALAGNAGPGETVQGEFTNDRPDDPYPERWRPTDPGTYLLAFTAGGDQILPEVEGGLSNAVFAGVEVGTPDIADVQNWEELIHELTANRGLLEIHLSVDDGALDGLSQSFLTTGRWPDAEGYEEFRAIVAMRRVTSFDFATSVVTRLIEGDLAKATQMLDAYSGYMKAREEQIGDEVIYDFFNTFQDATPFSDGDPASLKRGVTGNVASVVHAYFAHQYVSQQRGQPDARFQDYALGLLFGGEHSVGLLGRQVDDPGSGLYGLFLARPPSYFSNGEYANVENNLRVYDALGMALAVVRDRSYMPPLDIARRRRLEEAYADLRGALRRALVDTPVTEYSEGVDAQGPMANQLDAQDLYTLGGIFLLGEGEIDKALEALALLDARFVCRHPPGSEDGHRWDISQLDYPPLVGDVGVSFFAGIDQAGDLGVGRLDFEDPAVISSQVEATLDYMLFVDRLTAYLQGDPAAQARLAARFDLMAHSLVQLYNDSSDKGLMPNSSRAIPNLFSAFDAALPTDEANLIELGREGKDPDHIYRGFRPGPSSDALVTHSAIAD
ncbi:hypothetical protein LCGC14_2144900, partial [marine sediment metagenome]